MVQVQGISQPWIKLVRCLWSPSEIESQVENNLVYGTSSLRNYASCPESQRVEGKLYWALSLSYSWSHSLPLVQMLSPGHRLWGRWPADSGSAESLVWSGEVVVLEPLQMSWDPGELFPPVEVPDSSDELVAAPVMMAASELGTFAAWRRAAFSTMVSRLTWIATRIWTFSSCVCFSFSFSRRRSFLFWKRRIWERGPC